MITEEELKYFYSITKKKYCQKAGNNDMTESFIRYNLFWNFEEAVTGFSAKYDN